MKLRVVPLGILVLIGVALPHAAAAQASCTFAVDYPTIRVGPAPESVTVRLRNSSTCVSRMRTVTSTVPWMTGNTSVTTEPTVYFAVQLQGNSTGAARTGVVVIDGQAAITITQGTAACVTAVTPASVAFPVAGGAATFSVQTSAPDCYWSVSGFPPPPAGTNPFAPGWVAPTGTNVLGLTSRFPAFDIGSRDFPVAARSNAFGPGARAVPLRFGGGSGGSGAPVTISQAAPTCQFTFTPNTVTIPANGGSVTVSLTGQGSDCAYTTESWPAESGVTVTSGASGSAPASVTVSMPPNPLSTERPARVTAVNGVLFITQSGPPVIVDSGGGASKVVAFGAARLTNGSIRITAPEPTRITNEVDPSATWTATASQPWIVLSPSAGASPQTMRISIDPAALAALQPGTLSATVEIFSSVAPQTPRRLDVVLRYYNGQRGTQGSPFGHPLVGFVDTPTNGAAGLAGSIAITGWAVDFVMVTGIRIYRDAVAGEAPGQVFIGHANRVPGARPDLAILYGGFPEWRMAGWGYLLLSNVLPNSGNGTFTFSAYADDIEGNHTLLGRRTVTIDNAHATKPFGTIDEPAEGQTVSGTILNRGWVLTPAGKMIPLDGRTINVYVDGTLVGPVTTYSVPRPDVKAYFPGLENSDGPEARLMIDTTQFADGIHTIAWGVVDDSGASEGIGSRFFTIQNGGASQVQRVDTSESASVLQKMAVLSTDVWSRQGVDEGGWAVRAGHDASSGRIIRSRQGTRLEVFLDPMLRAACGTYRGYLLSGPVADALPDGASLDALHGIFRWQPTAGFLGTYRFAFVQRGCDGIDRRIPLSVLIGP
jgi:hypothetical protein